MLTKIGVQILNEQKTELTTDIDDRRKQFFKADIIEGLSSLLGLLPQFVSSFCISFAVVMGLFLMVLDVAMLESLFATPVGELIAAKNNFVAFFVAFFIFIYGLFFIARKVYTYRGAKEQYRNKTNAYHEQTKQQIELIEEVLYRHQLINKKEL